MNTNKNRRVWMQHARTTVRFVGINEEGARVYESDNNTMSSWARLEYDNGKRTRFVYDPTRAYRQTVTDHHTAQMRSKGAISKTDYLQRGGGMIYLLNDGDLYSVLCMGSNDNGLIPAYVNHFDNEGKAQGCYTDIQTFYRPSKAE